MGKSKPKQKRSSAIQLGKYRAIRAEGPEKLVTRMADLKARKELLEAKRMRDYRTEHDRITGDIMGMPAGLQRAEAMQRKKELGLKLSVKAEL